MGAVRVPVTAELENGQTLQTSADQRDMAAAEGADIDSTTKRLSWTRFVCWHALHRAGKYAGDFEAFNAECVEAYDAPAEVPAGDDAGLDPGQKAPTAGS